MEDFQVINQFTHSLNQLQDGCLGVQNETLDSLVELEAKVRAFRAQIQPWVRRAIAELPLSDGKSKDALMPLPSEPRN